jgi:hypothetical protein
MENEDPKRIAETCTAGGPVILTPGQERRYMALRLVADAMEVNEDTTTMLAEELVKAAKIFEEYITGDKE